ncbi:VOC family protein [Pelagibacterium halotolerans]|uniref:VOC domain-containing protein n=1 Tax=Pelagibacterium halotolerans (strain DSM 22347 / JCM 15775 / CGMCC 1.7692 / B2) TaxID=1082931 RepID=G4REX8_PELHB|nr:VOC family protein [Pelagibacterium halotolerans]AEQ51949.1 hypothetical protein KKY_1939 [Pelagibacterium halotolerans B2]QJR18260.1 glyoxalase/bleomycin resistance/extradiol dioxygenase family protein [Pelagibacterium halotolerans]SDZ80246.1 Uncharacterized conserved protein PhnB, glyoxalase superfamily [Pelagibacterium halotolerans]
MRFINPIPFVRDIELSKAFYQERLGLTIAHDLGNFVLFETGFAIHEGSSLQRSVWKEVREGDAPYGQKNLLLYFEHDDVDAAFASIAPHVDLIHPIERQDWGQRVFRFYDPDRHAIEVGEPLDLGTSGD